MSYEHAIERLKQHPFTLLGLSDREKFHTGLLAFALKTFPSQLVKQLFGCDSRGSIECIVDSQNIDLTVKCSSGEIAIAEVKVKTDIHDNQLMRYRSKFPTAVGRVIGLFPPVDSAVLLSSDFEYLSLTTTVRESVYACLVNSPREGLNPDEKALLQLWISYLAALDQLRPLGESHTCSIPASVVDGLRSVKLSGIFELQRLALVLTDAVTAARDIPLQGIELGNTRGNALIGLSFFVSSDNSVWVGLQLQATAIKLYICTNDHSRLKREDWLDHRDRALRECAQTVWGKLRAMNKPQTTDKLKSPSRHEGLFSSITIGRANTWDNCSSLGSDLASAYRELFTLREELTKAVSL